MELKGKSKVTGLKAKRSLNSVAGKDPKKAITSNKVKSSGLDMPKSQGKKPVVKAKRMK